MNKQLIAAVDLGGTAIKGALFSAAGCLVVKGSCATAARRGYRPVLNSIRSLLENLCHREQIPFDRIICAGVGIPAFLTNKGTEVVIAPNLGWRDKNVSDDLGGILGMPVYCDNDANLAALGECWAGAGRGTANMLMVTVGTGIGSGLILDGALYHGSTGMAGEMGHMVVAREGYPCRCGRRGCVETVAGAAAVVSEAKKLAAADKSSMLGSNITEAKQVYQAAAAGDTVALAVVERAAAYLGTAIANVLNLLDLEMVVIGGGVAAAGETMLAPLGRAVAAETVFFERRGVRLVPGQLGNDAGCYGAARWAMNQIEHKH